MEQNIRRIYKLCIAIVIFVAINLFITLMANVSFKSSRITFGTSLNAIKEYVSFCLLINPTSSKIITYSFIFVYSK